MAFEGLTIDSRWPGPGWTPRRFRWCWPAGRAARASLSETTDYVFAPCPACGEEIGHTVVSGKELYIEYLELDEAQGT
jgi:hydrogenase nickel incorporation protein HypA/HybF